MFPRGLVVGDELLEDKAFDVGPSRGVEVVGVVLVVVVVVCTTLGVDGRGQGSGVSIKESSMGFCVLVY